MTGTESLLGLNREPAGYGLTVPIPDLDLEVGRYRLQFARTNADLDRILTLRYQVFNLELGEGLEASHRTRRDEDDFDRRCHHLMVTTGQSGDVVGTYRMQTSAMARRLGGFYSAQEFQLDQLPTPIIGDAVEIGRACIARDHRNGRVLHLLWRGLAEYLVWNDKSILFGCCSITSQDPALGLAVDQLLAKRHAFTDRHRIEPLPTHRCVDGQSERHSSAHLPALFQAYLALGAKVVSGPAIDRAFKTIDWLVMLDVRDLDPSTRRAFFR